jgi:hypothetical protein
MTAVDANAYVGGEWPKFQSVYNVQCCFVMFVRFSFFDSRFVT